MKIYINNNTSFLIIKKYLDIGYHKKIYNEDDLKFINAALKYIAIQFQLDEQKPKKTRKKNNKLPIINEIYEDNISYSDDD